MIKATDKEFIVGQTLSEALRRELQIGNFDVKEQILLEMAGEVDNLQEVIQMTEKPSVKVAASYKRFIALHRLWVTLQERELQGKSDSKASILAFLMLQLQNVMKAIQMPVEQSETLLQALLTRLDEVESGSLDNKTVE